MSYRYCGILFVSLAILLWVFVPLNFYGPDTEDQVSESDLERPVREINSQDRILQELLYKKTYADSHGIPISRSRKPQEFLEASQKVNDPKRKNFFTIQYYESLLQLGRTSELIEHASERSKLSNGLPIQHLRLLGLAYFHRWDCVRAKKTEDCIFPLGGGDRDVERAMSIFDRILSEYSNDLSLRWLWNLGSLSMNRNERPDRWGLDNLLEKESERTKKYSQTASRKGLARPSKRGGVILEDFTGNDRLDIVTSSRSYRQSLEFYVNQGDGEFERRTKKAGLEEFVGGINITQTDYNNDGNPDIYITRGGSIAQETFTNSLLRNNGDGTFTDVTYDANLDGEFRSQVAAWADVNKNGYLDLFVGNEATKGFESARSRLYLNQGDGTFEEVSGAAGVDVNGVVRGADWGDVNNDGFPDLYVSLRNSPNKLFLNRSDTGDSRPVFRDITGRAGVEGPVESRLTWFWDVNNDGRQDLFVGVHPFTDQKIAHDFAASYLEERETPERSYVYINEGNMKFKKMKSEDRPSRSFYVQGGNYGDVNLDGYPDLYLGVGVDRSEVSFAPNGLYVNENGNSFSNITLGAGVGHVGQTGGVALADLENNGAMDIYAVMGGVFNVSEYKNVLFESSESGHEWIGLEVIGEETNRPGVGTRIEVDVKTDDGNVRTIHQTVDNGGSYGANPYRQFVGLGDAEAVKALRIEWPVGDPKKQTFQSVKMNKHYQIKQGASNLDVLKE